MPKQSRCADVQGRGLGLAHDVERRLGVGVLEGRGKDSGVVDLDGSLAVCAVSLDVRLCEVWGAPEEETLVLQFCVLRANGPVFDDRGAVVVRGYAQRSAAEPNG